MKIVHINTFSKGSTGTLASSIHNYLLSKGYQSYFFYGIGNTIDKHAMCFSKLTEVHLHSFLSRVFGLPGYFSIFSTIRLIKKIKKIKPDIIHLHNIHGSYINYILLFKYIIRNKIKIVLTLHDCCFFTGKCPHFENVGCYRWQKSCGKCKQLKRYPKSLFFDFTKQMLLRKKKLIYECGCVKIITVSKWLLEQANKSFLGCFKLDFIYNGIDTSLYKRNENANFREMYELTEKFIILGVASEWCIEKGVDVFTKLSGVLKKNEIIVMVGNEKKEQLKFYDNIIHINRTSSVEELIDIYSSSNVLLVTSTEETFGLVAIESMACGTPVIVPKKTALTELVKDGCCWGVEESSVDEFRRMIDFVKYKITPDTNNKCSDYVKNDFCSEKMLLTYEETYRSFYK